MKRALGGVAPARRGLREGREARESTCGTGARAPARESARSSSRPCSSSSRTGPAADLGERRVEILSPGCSCPHLDDEPGCARAVPRDVLGCHRRAGLAGGDAEAAWHLWRPASRQAEPACYRLVGQRQTGRRAAARRPRRRPTASEPRANRPAGRRMARVKTRIPIRTPSRGRARLSRAGARGVERRARSRRLLGGLVLAVHALAPTSTRCRGARRRRVPGQGRGGRGREHAPRGHYRLRGFPTVLLFHARREIGRSAARGRRTGCATGSTKHAEQWLPDHRHTSDASSWRRCCVLGRRLGRDELAHRNAAQGDRRALLAAVSVERSALRASRRASRRWCASACAARRFRAPLASR